MTSHPFLRNPLIGYEHVKSLIQHLDTDDKLAMHKFLVANGGDKQAKLGAGCAGTNMFHGAVQSTLQAISDAYPGEKALQSPKTMWAAENGASKRDFIKRNEPPQHMLHCLSECCQSVAIDVDTGDAFLMPKTDLSDIGWPCVGVSIINPNRPSNDRCIERGQTETGKVFAHFCDFLRSPNASLVNLGENVPSHSFSDLICLLFAFDA